MKNSTLLAGLALLAAIALFFVNEIRVNQKLAAWREASAAQVNTAAPSPDWLDAQAGLQRTRAELAAAEAQIAALHAKVAALERQQTMSTRRMTLPAPGAVVELTPQPDTPAVEVRRAWGPEQATGPADTFQAGDISTAWAPLQQDGGPEWLKLDYEKPVDLAEVRVHETHNPGAISKITAFVAGREVTIWEGVEPDAVAPVVRMFAVPFAAQASSVKVYLDTRRVTGWNEIDAVEVVGRDGTRQWAKKATASSTYAEQGGGLERLGGERLIEFEGPLILPSGGRERTRLVSPAPDKW